MIKTAELDPEQSYIFGCHPHGIFGFGYICAFATDALDIKNLFPGIVPKLVTLPVQFRLPFGREVAMMTGAVSSSKSSLEHVLK